MNKTEIIEVLNDITWNSNGRYSVEVMNECRREAIAAEFYHTAGLIYHDIDLNQKIVNHAEEVISGYESVGDIYNSLLHRVNYADALMAIGKLSEAEPKMETAYYKSKNSGYRHAYNIACICYANVLSCLGKTSIALKYYEEGIGLSKKINHDWDYLYGRIWRCLSLSDFYDKKSIEISKCCEKEALDKGYDYLVSLARTFNCICRYNLGEVVELADVNFINRECAPGHKLMVICLFLLTNENEMDDSKKYVDTIYELVDCCQGMKGRPEVLNTLFVQKEHLFYDMEKNKKIKDWINEYIVPYLNAYEKVEREILSKMPDEPNLRYCDMNKCPGFCCYDGAYLVEGEELKIKKFIKENRQLFSHKIQEYFMDGEWEGEKGRKTSIRPFQYDDRFPGHFEKTRCIFGDDNGICELQKNATLLDMHPWAYKPKACWLFPMDISNGQIAPPPLNKEDDPNNLGEDYPGYVSCLRCGIPSDEGMCWKKVYKQEILYYQHLNMLEELGTGETYHE